MLVGISGTICSGKEQITKYLVYHGFELVSTEDKSNSKELLEYVTSNWQKQMVLLVTSYELLEILSVRPFFLHLVIDAPSRLRFSRYNAKYPNTGISFEEFIDKSEDHVNNLNFLRYSLSNISPTINVVNKSIHIKDLYIQLLKLNIPDLSRLRPNWDTYFMKLANLASLRSNCMKRRVGCVIVKENRVIATGYNGTPRHLTNCNQGGCPRCNNNDRALNTCLCLHAEENALLESGRERINGDSILYCNTCPCLTCSIKIIQSGIKQVVYNQRYSMDEASSEILGTAGVQLRQFSPPTDLLISQTIE